MSNKLLALPLADLVRAYLHGRVALLKDELLDTLVGRTTADNHEQIVWLLKADPEVHILEITNYLCEVARPELKWQLHETISQLRLETQDRDALEDFDTTALQLGF